MEIVRCVEQGFRLFQIVRMCFFHRHQLINRIENGLLNAGAGVKLVQGDDLIDLIIHAFCPVIPVADIISDRLILFIQQNKIHAPGIHAHTAGDFPDLAAFLQPGDDLPENTVMLPAEFPVFFHHSVLKTVNLLKLHLPVFHPSEHDTAAGRSHIHCCVILRLHCKTSFALACFLNK